MCYGGLSFFFIPPLTLVIQNPTRCHFACIKDKVLDQENQWFIMPHMGGPIFKQFHMMGPWLIGNGTKKAFIKLGMGLWLHLVFGYKFESKLLYGYGRFGGSELVWHSAFKIWATRTTLDHWKLAPLAVWNAWLWRNAGISVEDPEKSPFWVRRGM